MSKMDKQEKEKQKKASAAQTDTAGEKTAAEADAASAASPAADENKAAEELEELKAQNEELTAKNAELNDQLLRRAAEFDNYRKRTAKEKEELTGFAKAMCIKEILGVIDNFERALATDCKDPDFKKGMDMIFHQLDESLRKLGVQEIEALNQTFDPEVHNAIKQVQDESFGENTICQVLQKGYKLEDRVIRHSMVVVANP